jgi:methylmalonyl-CoA mutase
VNTFVNPDGEHAPPVVELARSTDGEKQSQLRRVRAFQDRHPDREDDLDRLRRAALRGENLFAVLMDVVRTCSLGEITDALFEVGGRYRRNL